MSNRYFNPFTGDFTVTISNINSSFFLFYKIYSKIEIKIVNKLIEQS